MRSFVADRSGGSIDLVLAVGVGAIGATMVVGLPAIVPLALVACLAVAALTTRFDVGAVASSLALLTAFTIPMNRPIFGIPFPLSDALVVAAVAVYALMRLVERQPSAARGYRSLGLGVTLLAVGGFVGALAEVPGPFIYQALGQAPRDVSGWGHNLGNLGKFLIGSLLPIGLWILIRPSRAFMRQMVGAFVAGCAVSALAGLTLPSGRAGPRAIGLTVHANQYGSLCLLATGAALGLVLSQRRPKLWLLPVFPLLAAGILQSGSRAALGGLGVLVLIVGPLSRDRRVMAAVLVGAAVVILVFASGLVKAEGENALGRSFGGSSTAATSSTVRDDLGERVFARWQARPLTGQGYNYMRPSHNVYLGILASAGVLGIVGMATIVGSIVRRVWSRREDLLIVGVAAGYFAYLANAYFDNIFWWRWLWFYVGMVVAVLGTQSRSRGAERPEELVEELEEPAVPNAPTR